MRKIWMTVLLCMMASAVFAVRAVSQDKGLNLRQQSIVKIASCTGRGDLEALKPALAEGLDHGMTINEIREVLIHAYAYCGFPRSLRALQTFMDVLDQRQAQGIKDVVGRDASPVNDSRSRYERGRDILTEISGVPGDAPEPAYAEFAPVIEKFLKELLFADLFERVVLTYAERDLATVSVIAALGESVEPMLRSHMGICRNLGMTEDQLAQMIGIVKAGTDGKLFRKPCRKTSTRVISASRKTTMPVSRHPVIQTEWKLGSASWVSSNKPKSVIRLWVDCPLMSCSMLLA